MWAMWLQKYPPVRWLVGLSANSPDEFLNSPARRVPYAMGSLLLGTLAKRTILVSGHFRDEVREYHAFYPGAPC